MAKEKCDENKLPIPPVTLCDAEMVEDEGWMLDCFDMGFIVPGDLLPRRTKMRTSQVTPTDFMKLTFSFSVSINQPMQLWVPSFCTDHSGGRGR